MKADKNRLLFFVGTGLLIIAIIELTILPYILKIKFPFLYIPVERHKVVVGYIYMLALISYVFSIGYYKKQVTAIFWIFIYYILFQLIIANI